MRSVVRVLGAATRRGRRGARGDRGFWVRNLRRGLVLAVGFVLVGAVSAVAAPPGAGPLPSGFVGVDRGAPEGFDERSDPLASRAARSVVDRLGERERDRWQRKRERLAGADRRGARQRSRAAYRGLGAGQARALFEQTFAGLLAEPAVERLGKSGPVRSFLGDFSARVGGGVAVSSVPLRARESDGGKAPIDLSLQRVGERYEPALPFVGVWLPERLSDGFEVGSGERTKVAVAGAAPVSATATGGKGRALHYGEALEDVDVVFSAGELGVQILAQVRSPQAPETIALDVTPPAGARLVQAGPGAEVVRGDELLAYITPPRTLDAQGQEVPSALRVTGGRVELSIEHRSADVAYPLLVDPWVAENYGSWYYQQNTAALDGYGRRWFSDRPPDWFFKDEPREWWVPSTWCNGGLGGCYGGSGRGLMAYAYPNGSYPAGTFGEWIYTIPGYNFDNPGGEPTTYIAMFDFQQQGMNCRNDYSGSPLLLNGIFSPVGDNWTAVLGHGCGNPNAGEGPSRGGVEGGVGGDPEPDPNSGSFLFSSALGAGYNGVRPKEEGKIAAFATELQTGGVRSQWLDAYMGGAIAYLDDPEIPTPDPLIHSVSPNQWTQGNETRTVIGSATDPGLGVKWFNLERQGTNGQYFYLTQAQHPCTATRQSRCPRSWSATLGYSTTSLPEGITNYKLRAFDPGYADNNESSQQTWPVKIDRTPPSLDVTGALRSADDGLTDPQYAVNLIARDGDSSSPSAQRSGVERVTVTVTNEAGQVEKTETLAPGCSGNDSCGYSSAWTFSTDDYPDGRHKIKVMAQDRVGQESAPEEWWVTVDRRGDIYEVREYDGPPSADGELLAEEWSRFGTTWARSEEEGQIATRATRTCPDDPVRMCDEVRTRQLDPDTGQASESDDFQSVIGTKVDDPQLEPVADIAQPKPSGTRVGSGPIRDAIASWQKLPPAHGTQYELYEEAFTEEDENGIPVELRVFVWVDALTELPLRQRTDSTPQSGSTDSDTFYYTYGQDRLELSQVPANYFAVQKPSQPNSDESTSYGGPTPVGSKTDTETGSTFIPASVGLQPTLGGFSYCLTGSEATVSSVDEPAVFPAVGDDPETAPDPSATITSVDIKYRKVAASADCLPGGAQGDPPDLTVTAYARASTVGRAWTDSYQRALTEYVTDPGLNGSDRAGVEVVQVLGQPATAYFVPYDESELAVLMATTTTVYTIKGLVARDQIADLANAMREF